MTEANDQKAAVSCVDGIGDQQWFAGIDWASQKHDVALHDVGGKIVSKATFEHSGNGMASLADWLVATSGALPHAIAVAIERPDGPVVEMLLERGFKVYSINPKQLDRFRDRFSPAGAKDDSRDTDVLASALRTDPQAFRKLLPDAPLLVELREWQRMAEEHHQDLVRLTNRLDQVLLRYYPAFRQLEGASDAAWKLVLFELAPTPQIARYLSRAKVARLLKRYHVRVHDADEVLQIIRQRPIELPTASVQAASQHALALAQSVRFTAEQLNTAERAMARVIDVLCRGPGDDDTSGGASGERQGDSDATANASADAKAGRPSDAAILVSMPGHGNFVLASLLTNASAALRERDYGALRCLGGVAPVTKQSGKSRHVVRRYACNHRIREALFHWARIAIQHDPQSRAKYNALRQRGKTFGRALRTVADRLLYVACTLLENGTLYDPNHAKKIPVTG
jgi:transposase